jgi:TonB family protein
MLRKAKEITMVRDAALAACLLLATLPTSPVQAAPPAAAQEVQEPHDDEHIRAQIKDRLRKLEERQRLEARLRAALGGEDDAQARVELIELLLKSQRDDEVGRLLPETATPEGLARARSLLCRGSESLDDLPAGARNARLQAILPQAAVHVGDGVTHPKILARRAPQYTDEARAAKLNGIVILSGIIDETGAVAALEVRQGLPMGLDTAAQEAAREWTFRPALSADGPVAVCYHLTFNFQVE